MNVILVALSKDALQLLVVPGCHIQCPFPRRTWWFLAGLQQPGYIADFPRNPISETICRQLWMGGHKIANITWHFWYNLQEAFCNSSSGYVYPSLRFSLGYLCSAMYCYWADWSIPISSYSNLRDLNVQWREPLYKISFSASEWRQCSQIA